MDLIPLLSNRKAALRIWVVCTVDMVHLTPTVDACGVFFKEPWPKFDWKLVWFSLIHKALIFPSRDIFSTALPWKIMLRNHWKTTFNEIKMENGGNMWLNISWPQKILMYLKTPLNFIHETKSPTKGCLNKYNDYIKRDRQQPKRRSFMGAR